MSSTFFQPLNSQLQFLQAGPTHRRKSTTMVTWFSLRVVEALICTVPVYERELSYMVDVAMHVTSTVEHHTLMKLELSELAWRMSRSLEVVIVALNSDVLPPVLMNDLEEILRAIEEIYNTLSKHYRYNAIRRFARVCNSDLDAMIEGLDIKLQSAVTVLCSTANTHFKDGLRRIHTLIRNGELDAALERTLSIQFPSTASSFRQPRSWQNAPLSAQVDMSYKGLKKEYIPLQGLEVPPPLINSYSPPNPEIEYPRTHGTNAATQTGRVNFPEPNHAYMASLQQQYGLAQRLRVPFPEPRIRYNNPRSA